MSSSIMSSSIMSSKIPKFARPRTLRGRRVSPLLIMAVLGAMALGYILLSLAPCMISGVCYHGYRSAFSFDAGLASHATWMADIPDDVNITSLSIPGTHDTMTYEMKNEGLQCQNWNISSQLNAGLRYFDIRARQRDDRLHIYHSYGDTGFGFKDVLLAMFAFLEKHPSEAIIMRLKKEGSPMGHNNTIEFEDAFNYHRLNSSSTSEGASKHFHLYDRKSPIPNLGTLRGKIFILQEFDSPAHGPYGLEWDGPQMVLEDLWIIPDVYHLSEKWTAIREALELAGTKPHDNSVLYLAHVSAAVGVLPIEAAAGPMNRTIAGMNDMTGQWLEDFDDEPGYSRTGVVILDFPGRRLIDVILSWNGKLKGDHNLGRNYLH